MVRMVSSVRQSAHAEARTNLKVATSLLDSGRVAIPFSCSAVGQAIVVPSKGTNIWTIKGEKTPTHDQSGSDEINNMLVVEQKKPDDNQQETKAAYPKNLLPPWLCDDSRFTDFLIAYFTYCLVVVGWFGIRNTERQTRNLERAFIFGTPEIDAEKTDSGDGSTFVQIMLHNTGRTAGTVKVIYGEVSPTTEPYGDPIYKNGSARTANGMLPPAPVTFECPVTADFYFFGYVEYDDHFRRAHTSRFCAKVFLDRSGIEAAGNDAFNDWN
jgi:hypothetical protein